ncbi:MAG: ABC transporter ATP-binding protein [Candidatus Omnitrophica bacterium]|nr:ABC transporter ATP-binding protein [Candidatus Omnitrophota bacterium]
MNTIEFRNVWKKFRKGEKFNSLRDSIPNLFRNIFKGKKTGEALENQEFWAVKDVNFSLKRGEVVGIIGPNGAGKSTILKLLSGIIVPNKGTLELNGRLSALIEVTAGFHPELTGRENVYLNGTILGMKKKEIDERFEEIVEFSGVREFIDTPVKRYSSGMFSRLGFSVAAHVNPDVLLVDEVLAVGDIAFQAKCAAKMRDLFNSGVTIVLVSHNIPLIQNLCERVILLDKGEVLKEGNVNDVIPYYEDIVFKMQEGELKKKLDDQKDRVKVDTQSVVNIPRIDIMNGRNEIKDTLDVGTHLKVKIHFEAREKIEKPIFDIGISRADGVLCCCGDSKSGGLKVDFIEGEGALDVDFGTIHLMPGIYVVKVTVWDQALIHPYVVKRNDIFRISENGSKRHSKSIFKQNIQWDLKKG